MTDRAITVTYGDTVLFVGRDRKTFVRTLRPGGRLQTHHGVVLYDDLIGLVYGSKIWTHLEQPMWLLQPNIDDLIRNLRRESQIIFPKDAGYILMKLNVQPGAQVIEAGTGSGGLTLALALAVGDAGRVYSYDRRADMQKTAHNNLARLSLDSRVTFIERDISAGFDQQNVDALFLDVPDPWVYLEQVWRALRGGGFFGCIVPTMNQVVTMVDALYREPWFFLQVEELLLRAYKTVPVRVRPDDQMIGHTGYLVFARALTADDPDMLFEAEARTGSELPDG